MIRREKCLVRVIKGGNYNVLGMSRQAKFPGAHNLVSKFSLLGAGKIFPVVLQYTSWGCQVTNDRSSTAMCAKQKVAVFTKMLS